MGCMIQAHVAAVVNTAPKQIENQFVKSYVTPFVDFFIVLICAG